MNQPATSVRNHCLSPTRAKVAIDAPLGPTAYGRIFPELPSFEADEQFLRALGRAGGICDCGDVEDDFYPGYAHTFTESGKERGWPSRSRS